MNFQIFFRYIWIFLPRNSPSNFKKQEKSKKEKRKKKAFLFEGVPLIVLQFIFNVIYIAQNHNNCRLKVLFIL